MQSLTRPGATGLNHEDVMAEKNLTAFSLDELRDEAKRTNRTVEELRAIQRQQLRWEGDEDRRAEAQARQEQRAAAQEQDRRQAEEREQQVKRDLEAGNIPTPIEDQAIAMLEAASLTPAGRTELDQVDHLVNQQAEIKARYQAEVQPVNAKLATMLDKNPEWVASAGATVIKREATASAYSGYLIIHGIRTTFTKSNRWLKAHLFPSWSVDYIRKRRGGKEKPKD